MASTPVTLHDLYPDRAFYRPGEEVRLIVELAAERPCRVRVTASITHLAKELAAPSRTLALQRGRHSVTLNWRPPPTAPRGYGVDVRVEAEGGEPLDRRSTAFDVLERWSQRPRYGFLTDFTPGREDVDQTVAALARYHINGLQFYDWMYRHAELLPPEGQEEFTDPLGRRLSMGTVRAFIAAAHARNMAAMPYTAIYGASPEFAEARPGWVLYRPSGEPITFAGGFLTLMNPASGSPWAEHLLGQFEAVLRATDFDGLHIDQYGEEHTGSVARDAAGRPVDLPEAFVGMIRAARARATAISPRRNAIVFNCVANWPIEAIAPAEVDFVYIELWPPDVTYGALHRVIVQAWQLSGGKPVVLAAYTDPQKAVTVRLMKAVIFASGGTQIELGERDGMLADPYFPQYRPIPPALRRSLRRYYDFAVRYGDVLAGDAQDATPQRAARILIEGQPVSADLSPDTVAVISRRGAGFEALSLINLRGIHTPQWTDPAPPPPLRLTDLRVRVYVEGPVRRLRWASPDVEPRLRPLPFAQGADRKGAYLEFTLPELAYWALIILEATAEDHL